MITDSSSTGKSEVCPLAYLQWKQPNSFSRKQSDPNEKHLRTDILLTDSKDAHLQCVCPDRGPRRPVGLQLASIMVLARLLTPRLWPLRHGMTGWALRIFKTHVFPQRRSAGGHHACRFQSFLDKRAMSGAASLILGRAARILRVLPGRGLIPITLVLSSTFLLSGLAVQHTALLNGRCDFQQSRLSGRFDAESAIGVGIRQWPCSIVVTGPVCGILPLSPPRSADVDGIVVRKRPAPGLGSGRWKFFGRQSRPTAKHDGLTYHGTWQSVVGRQLNYGP